MVKGTMDEPLCKSIITQTEKELEKPTKKKKKKQIVPCENADEELNLVPSNIDPTFLVHVAKDHRVNLDGVLDEKMQSKVDEWLNNDSAFSGRDVHSTSLVVSPITTTVNTGGLTETFEENVDANGISSKAKVNFSMERSHVKLAEKNKRRPIKAKKLKRHVTKIHEVPFPSARAADDSAAENVIVAASIEDNSGIAKEKKIVNGTHEQTLQEYITTLKSANNSMKYMMSLNECSSTKICTVGESAVATVAAAWNAGITVAGTTPADCTAGTVHADCTAGSMVTDCCMTRGKSGLSKVNKEGESKAPTRVPAGQPAAEVTQIGTTIPKIDKGGKSLDLNEKLNFAGLFKENRLQGNGFKLSFHECINDEVVLDENDEVPVVENWGYCLIGCFTGPFPGRESLDNIVTKWGLQCRVFPYGKGWTVFRFMNDIDRMKVFYGGPYIAYGKTLMLKTIDDGAVLTDDLFMKIPTWVLFHNVPLSIWSESGLSKLSSKVGTPLYSDKVTKERTRMNYARCLIEVDVSKVPISEFPVTMSKGRKYVQKISYEHFPGYCCECKKFGHNMFSCPKNTTAKAVLVAPNRGLMVKNFPSSTNINGMSIPKNKEKVPMQVAIADRGKAPAKSAKGPLAATNKFTVLSNAGETSGTHEAINEDQTAKTTVATPSQAAINEAMVKSVVLVVPEHGKVHHDADGIASLQTMEGTSWEKMGVNPKKKGRGRASSSFVPKR